MAINFGDYTVRSSAWILPERAGVWDGCGSDEWGIEELDALFNEKVRDRMAVDNCGRFPEGTRAAFAASVMALEAGDRSPGEPRDSTTGIIAAGFDHTMEQNRDYFQDYADNGRIMGRGNLFIYTLPTSAIAEVAIGLGMDGPLFYEELTGSPFAGLLKAGCDCMESGQAEQMVVVWQHERATVSSFLMSDADEGCPMGAMTATAAEWTEPSSAIEYFRRTHETQVKGSSR